MKRHVPGIAAGVYGAAAVYSLGWEGWFWVVGALLLGGFLFDIGTHPAMRGFKELASGSGMDVGHATMQARLWMENHRDQLEGKEVHFEQDGRHWRLWAKSKG